jgi:CheY-like chemotaxis protein
MSNLLTQKTVLLVDDDPDFLYQQKCQLEAAGLSVVSAENERQAETILDESAPDLAVVDLMMENVDGGFTLCYHIKKKYPHVPVILVTSVNNETGLYFDAGDPEQRDWIKADAFLSKPIRFEQLKKEVDRLLGVNVH